MSRTKKDTPNYFGAYLEKYTMVKRPDDVLVATRQALTKGTLHSLFTDLFFKDQELGLLKICDYVVEAYLEQYGNSAIDQVISHMSTFAKSLSTPNREPIILEEQQVFLEFLQMYLEAKRKAEEDLQQSSRVAVSQLKRQLIDPVTEKSQQDVFELIRNAAAVSPHSLLLLIEASLSHHQRLVIELLEIEAIRLKNKLLSQDAL